MNARKTTVSILFIASHGFAQYQMHWAKNLEGTQVYSNNYVCSQQGINIQNIQLYRHNLVGEFQTKLTFSNFPIVSIIESPERIILFNYSTLFELDTSGSLVHSYPLYWAGDSVKGFLSPTDVNVIGNYMYAKKNMSIFKYDLHGVYIWEKKDEAANVALRKSASHLFLAKSPFSSFDTHIVKFDTSGTEIWSVPSQLMFLNLVADSADNCYVLGAGNYGPCAVRKLNPDGSLAWQKSLDGMWVQNGYVYKDSLYVCGMISSYPEPSGPDDGKAIFEVFSVKTGEKGSSVIFNLNPMVDSNREIFEKIWVMNDEVYCAGKTGHAQFPKDYLVKFRRSGSVKTKLNEQNTPVRYKVFPNPAAREFTVVNPTGSSLTMELLDQTGRVVVTDVLKDAAFHNGHTVSVSHLARGIYYIKLTGQEAHVEIFKLVVD